VIPLSTLRINLGLIRLRFSELLVVVDDEDDGGPLLGLGLELGLLAVIAEVDAAMVEVAVGLLA